MEVHSEDCNGFRIAVYKIGDSFVCYVYTGAFGYHIVEQFTAKSGLAPTKLFDSIKDAVDHAKALINAGKLRA